MAAAMVSATAECHYSAIMDVLKAAPGPMGAEQIADWCGIDAYRIRKRLPEMKLLVELAPGFRRTRSGRMERLWRIKPT